MVTRFDAISANHFHHVSVKNADGSPARCRRNGATKFWKREPDRFRIPVKYGLKQCFYIDNGNARDWTVAE